MMQSNSAEFVVHVTPHPDGWHVKPPAGKETNHRRKAVAALRAKQLAANADEPGRVIFHRVDGTIELERHFERFLQG